MTTDATAQTAATVVLGRTRLTLSDLVAVARHGVPVELDESVRARLHESRAWVESVAGPGGTTESVYSINTGFGALAGRQTFTDPQDAAELSRRLVLSNAAGVGRYVDQELVRATMVIRVASLVSGHSAVRYDVVARLVEMLNAGVHPAIPEYGSLGASGDLIPLAHLALVLSCAPAGSDDDDLDSGEAWWDERVVSGAEAMAAAALARVPLGAKEGLALLNGTSFSCAQVALALHDAENLLQTGIVTSALAVEALKGFGDAFIQELHEARGQRGQVQVAQRMRELLAGAELVDGDREHDPARQPPQDAYSLRCVPQVLGPVWDTLDFVHGIVDNELNAATDNPLVFPALPRSLKAVSGGNFHAEYLAFAADFLSIVVTEIGNIAERRLFRLDDGSLNRGLPDMLIASDKVGLDCGYMLPQYLAAALVSDCKTLAHPDSVDSIPTCANQEDHVSMANNAGRHARQVVANIESVIAVELLMVVQALELRVAEGEVSLPGLSEAGRAVCALVRSAHDHQGRPLEHLSRDRVLYPWLRRALQLVHDGDVLTAVRGSGSVG